MLNVHPNSRPLMLLLATALAWCLLLCPSLSLAMQSVPVPGDDISQPVQLSGGCHSPAPEIVIAGDHGSCDSCQAAEQIPGEFSGFADAAARNGFVPDELVSDPALSRLTREPIPPDHPPLFLVHEAFLI